MLESVEDCSDSVYITNPTPTGLSLTVGTVRFEQVKKSPISF